MTVTLSPQDAYTLARAFVGLSWDQQPVGSIAELLLSQLDLNAPEDLRFLRKLLGSGSRANHSGGRPHRGAARNRPQSDPERRSRTPGISAADPGADAPSSRSWVLADRVCGLGGCCRQ